MPDDNGATMREIIAEVSAQVPAAECNWRRLEASVVRIPDAAARIFIKMAFERGRPAYQDGSSLLDADEVIVCDQHRDECRRLLEEVCPSRAEWLDLVYLTTKSEAFSEAFAAAYTETTGLPSPSSRLDGDASGEVSRQAVTAESLIAALDQG